MRVVLPLTLLACVWIGVAAPAYAEGPVWPLTGSPALDSLGSLNLHPPGFKPQQFTRVTVNPKLGKHGAWWEENYVLQVSLASGKTVSKDFYAAYGSFVLYVPFGISRNGPKQAYSKIVLITAHGKGTDVTHYRLQIYGMKDGQLKSLFSKRIADYFGMGEMWWYTPSFEEMTYGDGAPTNSSRGLTLVLHHDPISKTANEDPTEIPTVSVLCVLWKKGGFTEVDGKSCSHIVPLTSSAPIPDVLRISKPSPPSTGS